jgi:hypothetical protein
VLTLDPNGAVTGAPCLIGSSCGPETRAASATMAPPSPRTPISTGPSGAGLPPLLQPAVRTVGLPAPDSTGQPLALTVPADYLHIPSVLRRLDLKMHAHLPEPLPTQLLWQCVAALPTLAELFGFGRGLRYFLGGPGAGDIWGIDDADRHNPTRAPIRASVEVKSARARASYGAACRNRCGQYKSQLEHQAEHVDAVMVAVTHTGRAKAVQQMAGDAGVAGRLNIWTYTDVAAAVELALSVDMQGATEPVPPLLFSLFDVDDVADPQGNVADSWPILPVLS